MDRLDIGNWFYGWYVLCCSRVRRSLKPAVYFQSGLNFQVKITFHINLPVENASESSAHPAKSVACDSPFHNFVLWSSAIAAQSLSISIGSLPCACRCFVLNGLRLLVSH
jgi:hypothetical protein